MDGTGLLKRLLSMGKMRLGYKVILIILLKYVLQNIEDEIFTRRGECSAPNNY
jgi:hypothetical protein